MDILLTYATTHGSTRVIAQRIATQLSGHGHQVEVVAVGEVKDVSGYGAVVLGSPVHGGAWLADATDFVQAYKTELAARPVWLFSVGLIGDTSSAFPSSVEARLRSKRKEPKQISALRETIHPVGHRYFAGVIQRGHLPLPVRIVFKMFGGRYGDHRDWDDIDAWGDEIAAQVTAGQSSSA